MQNSTVTEAIEEFRREETALAIPALLDTARLESSLAQLRKSAAQIQVTDQNSYQIACNIALGCRSFAKEVKGNFLRHIEAATNRLNFFKNQQSLYLLPAKAIDDEVSQKAELWKQNERRRAQAEEDRINAERRAEQAKIAEQERLDREKQAELDRKAREREIEKQRKAGEIGVREAERQKKAAAAELEAEKDRAAQEAKRTAANVQEVSVAPSIPLVAGIKRRVNYKFEVVDTSKLPRAYLMPDLVAIGREVRDDKDCAKSMRNIPGIRVWEEDSI